MKSKTWVGAAMIVAMLMFVSIIAFGILPDYLAAKTSQTNQTLIDIKNQNPPSGIDINKNTGTNQNNGQTTIVLDTNKPSTTQNPDTNTIQPQQPAPPVQIPVRRTRAS